MQKISTLLLTLLLINTLFALGKGHLDVLAKEGEEENLHLLQA